MGEFYLLCRKIFFLTFLCACTTTCFAQNYGLRFSSHEVVQDKRTSLDLTSPKGFTFNNDFEISFDLAFFPAYNVYYGYIVRIIGNDNQNFDLVYNTAKNHFNLIVGDKEPQITFDIGRDKLYSGWSKLKIKLDAQNNQLQVTVGGKVYMQNNVRLNKNAIYKIIFGTNNYKQFETTDIPPMKLRDIRITQNGSLKYHWPLNETGGAIAHELVKQQDAVVVNPFWVSSMHQKWQKEQAITVNGMASVTFNPQKEALYIVASDSVYTYDIANASYQKSPAAFKLNLNQGNRSVYNPLDGNLYSFYPDIKYAAKYNFEKQTWDRNFKPGLVTRYWHVNKIISKEDSSMYLFGGYGYLVYHNNVQQYHFNTGKWDSILYKGDFFMPRYLAAMGATPKGDTAYILGGYGNASGQQILNPKNMYDMMRFTVKDRTFKKMFDLKPRDGDFTFANSLIIDPKTKSYYGLIFPRHTYNSVLKLIHGSLTSPFYEVLETGIPYSFHDVHSFADLYYCPQSNKFVAVTLLRTESNQTHVAVYTLLGPPYYKIYQPGVAQQNHNLLYIVGVVALVLAGAGFFYYKKTRAVQPVLHQSPVIFEPLNKAEQVQPLNHHHAEIELIEEGSEPSNEKAYKNTILLFGDLQIYDAGGVEITKLFTPLIKEMFLHILLYTIRIGRGISSEKLNEMFWIDKSEKSARNNRSVSIVKLKTLLERMDHCMLSKETGTWTIDIDYSYVYVDYHDYLSLVKGKRKLDKEKIKSLSMITQRGNFLSNNEYEWLDTFKSEISNDVINTYLRHAQSPEFSYDPEFLIEIANYIFHFDPVNEDAMILKCKAFSVLGKHSLAKHTFENFKKTYKSIYERDFKRDFQAIVA